MAFRFQLDAISAIIRLALVEAHPQTDAGVAFLRRSPPVS